MCPAESRLALKVALWLREGRLIGVAALATRYGCGTKAARTAPQHLASATLLQGHQSPIHRPHHYTPPTRLPPPTRITLASADKAKRAHRTRAWRAVNTGAHGLLKNLARAAANPRQPCGAQRSAANESLPLGRSRRPAGKLQY